MMMPQPFVMTNLTMVVRHQYLEKNVVNEEEVQSVALALAFHSSLQSHTTKKM